MAERWEVPESVGKQLKRALMAGLSTRQIAEGTRVNEDRRVVLIFEAWEWNEMIDTITEVRRGNG